MRFRRITFVLVCAFTILFSAVAALVIRQARGDDLDSTLWMNALLILVGLLMLTRATLGPSAKVIPDRCLRCGGPTFETARSLDRRRVRTCFTCGQEDATGPTIDDVAPPGLGTASETPPLRPTAPEEHHGG